MGRLGCAGRRRRVMYSSQNSANLPRILGAGAGEGRGVCIYFHWTYIYSPYIYTSCSNIGSYSHLYLPYILQSRRRTAVDVGSGCTLASAISCMSCFSCVVVCCIAQVGWIAFSFSDTFVRLLWRCGTSRVYYAVSFGPRINRHF